MRKIVAGLFMSLDGVVEAPETWHFPYFNDEMGQIVGDQMAASDTMLLGRRTYEEFAAFWPSQGDDVPLASGDQRRPKAGRLDDARFCRLAELGADPGRRAGGSPAPEGR